MKEMVLAFSNGQHLMMRVESARVGRDPLVPDGFTLVTESSDATILFLRTGHVDAVILRDVTEWERL